MNEMVFPAFFAGFGAIIAMGFILALILTVLLIVANWKIFQKAGEAGWKSLIPVYSDYVLYKIAWDVRVFWVLLGLAVLDMLLCWIPVVGAIASFLTSVLAIVIDVVCFIKLSKAFGHGGGFAIGLIFLPMIFGLILGFEQSEYLGPQE